MRGGLPVRTCTPLYSEPSDRSSTAGAHHRISRQGSVSCCRGAGEMIKTFFLVLDARERRSAGKQRLLEGGLWNNVDFTCTVDRPRPS